MGVSVSNSRVVYDSLKGAGVRVISALPETWLVHLIRMADDDPDVTLVRLARYAPPITPSTSVSAHHTPTARITVGTT